MNIEEIAAKTLRSVANEIAKDERLMEVVWSRVSDGYKITVHVRTGKILHPRDWKKLEEKIVNPKERGKKS